MANVCIFNNLNFFLGGFLDAFSPKRSYVEIMKSFQACAIYTPVLVPCLAMRFWLHPCEPYAPGFWLLDECSHLEKWNSFTISGSNATLYWAFICLLFTWALSKLIANHFFVNYQFVFLIASCIRYYLDNLLVQIRNPGKRFSTLEMIQYYKKIQLMMCFFNRVNQNYFIPVLLFLIGISYVIPSFAFLTVLSTMSIPQIFIMGSASYQVVICLFVGCGIFGGIYDDSIETLHAFRTANIQLETSKERKLCAKLVRSLCPIKVMIGSVNYIDKLEPITMSDFFLGMLVNLLLLR